ncbi:hypothetical protein QYF36_018370 [Acer negundo]|nr:hypothetical protein QYF36_018370 [Acer negundo]
MEGVHQSVDQIWRSVRYRVRSLDEDNVSLWKLKTPDFSVMKEFQIQHQSVCAWPDKIISWAKPLADDIVAELEGVNSMVLHQYREGNSAADFLAREGEIVADPLIMCISLYNYKYTASGNSEGTTWRHIYQKPTTFPNLRQMRIAHTSRLVLSQSVLTPHPLALSQHATLSHNFSYPTLLAHFSVHSLISTI